MSNIISLAQPTSSDVKFCHLKLFFDMSSNIITKYSTNVDVEINFFLPFLIIGGINGRAKILLTLRPSCKQAIYNSSPYYLDIHNSLVPPFFPDMLTKKLSS